MATVDPADPGAQEVASPPPAASTRPRRRAVQREELLDAADTVIRRVGSKASAALIAKEAGITKPIIYRHFGDLQDLYRALAIRHQERLTHYLRTARELQRSSDRRSRIRGVVGAFFTAIERERNLFQFLVKSPPGEMADQDGGPPLLTRRFAEQIGAFLSREASEQCSARWRALGYAVAGTLITTGRWWLEERTISREDAIDAVAELLVAGVPQPVASEAGPSFPPAG
jgi:AcrR family transcriptional regulator